MKTTIYETITNQIVSAIEEGAGLYKMPWHRTRADITNPVSRDRAERHELITGQIAERRSLQREIVTVRSRYAKQAEELHRDLKRQDPTCEAEEQSLTDSFNKSSGASEASPAASPRILRGRSASRSAREYGGMER